MNHEQIRQVLDFCHAVTDWQGEPNSRAKDDAIAICEAALAEPEDEPSTVLRLIDTIKYLVGIAERGEGRKARDDELPEQFVLGYVKRLEAALAEPSEPVYWVPPEREGEHHSSDFVNASRTSKAGWVPLFTHPAPSKPEPLSTLDLRYCFTSTNTAEPLAEGWPGLERYGRAIEAAVWEKLK